MRVGRFGAGRNRPNLLGTAARTAVVAGTASAVTGVFRRRHNHRNHVEPVAAPSPAISDDRLGRLERLAALRNSGVLTEAEFEVEKAKILDAPA